MSVNILFLGYFHRKNWGDDMFEYVLKKHVTNLRDKRVQTNLNFDNFDNLKEICKAIDTQGHNPYDYVIIGGGDLINDYYLGKDNVTLFRTYFASVPIIFYGVGLSFMSSLPLLDVGDFFWMRNKVDFEAVKYRYGKRFGRYTPDLGFLLLDEDQLKHYVRPNRTVQRIGVCFPYTWFDFERTSSKLFFKQLVEIVKRLSLNYKVHFIPFDTSENIKNSDLILFDKFKEVLGDCGDVFFNTNGRGGTTLFDQIEYFKSLDVVIGGRFHSVILSILTDTPFVSLVSTRKLDVLRKEIPKCDTLFVNLKTDDNYTPVSIDEGSFFDAFEQVTQNHCEIKNELHKRKWELYKASQGAMRELTTFFNDDARMVRNHPPQYISPNEKDDLIRNVTQVVLKSIRRLNVRNVDKIYNDIPVAQIISKRSGSNFAKFQKTIAEEILWAITGDPFAPYYYGLYENVFIKPLIPQINWIIEDYYQRFMYKSSNTGILTLVNKNFQELHRSGWQYIVDNLVVELNSDATITKPLVIDTYIDKTFHWNGDFYKSKGLIPYKQDWVGFIHHTFSSYNNSYNCETLFANSLFLESLHYCKGIIVMSKYLQKQVQQALQQLGHPSIKTHVIYHPSEFTAKVFSWETFMQQKQRHLVQVGNWLRDVFAIFKLEIPRTSIITGKAVLKNRNCDNYFLPEGALQDLFPNFVGNNPLVNNNVYDICKISFENMHMKGLYQYIVEMEESVQEIEYLNNTSYDELLSSSIVFINLIDASAVNTIIECIIRNTPILVNPVGSVKELLGEDYPLYYTTMYEASKLLDDIALLRSGYEYIVNMDKSKFYISTFVDSMKELLQTISK